MQKRAAIYIRVSTQEQSREGYSLAAQAEKLQAFAVAKGYTVTKVYSDPGYSGGNLDRPGIQQLIQDSKSKMFEVVLVYKLDRLSRSQKNTLYLIQDVFKPYNVDFISLQESFDTSTSFGVAMIGILSVFAELERATIKERVSMGREERAKQGYYHGGGNYNPLGYDYVDGELMLNEYESLIVREIFDLYVNGNSMTSTALLIREKYPERIKSKTIVKDVVRNPLYIGKVRFNKNVYQGRHVPIIDEGTFNKAQRIRKSRSVGSGANKQKGLLVGKIYCKQCGARFGRIVSGSRPYRYVYYKCKSQTKSANTNQIHNPNCTSGIWKEDVLDKHIIDKIKRLNIHAQIQKPEKNRLPTYDKELEKIDKQMDRLLDLYALGNIESDMINERFNTLNKRKAEIQALESNHKVEVVSEKKLLAAQSIDWENASLFAKIQAVHALIERIDLSLPDADITWSF